MSQAKQRQEGTKGKSIPKQKEGHCKDLEAKETRVVWETGVINAREKRGGKCTEQAGGGGGADAKESGVYSKDNEKPMENFQLLFPHHIK